MWKDNKYPNFEQHLAIPVAACTANSGPCLGSAGPCIESAVLIIDICMSEVYKSNFMLNASDSK